MMSTSVCQWCSGKI